MINDLINLMIIPIIIGAKSRFNENLL